MKEADRENCLNLAISNPRIQRGENIIHHSH
jgi:hypothetical protein